MIEFIKAIIIGIIQGITEVLPISSSAHNAIIYYYFYDSSITLTNEIFLHISSLLALIIFMRKDILELINDLFNKNFKSTINIIIATIPAFIMYLLFNYIFNSILDSIILIGFFLLITSLINMFIYSLYNKTRKDNITYKDSFLIGVCQSFALIPGISRSGITLYGGLLKSINYQKIVKFSLFLFMVATTGSIILEYESIKNINLNLINFVTFFTTFIFTLLSLKLIVNKIKRNHFIYFSLYTFILGLIIIILNIR